MEKEIEKKSVNLALSKSLSSVYSDVDGLSLQNLFYARNGYFPNCQMFTQNGRGGEYHFDIKGFYDWIRENTPEEENLEMVLYSTYNMSDDDESLGLCAVLNKSNLYLRIEDCVSESYILYDFSHVDKLKEMITNIKKFFVAPEPEKNNLFTLATTSAGYMLTKMKVREVTDFDVDEQYNDDFKKEDEKIMNFLSSDDNGGLVILHGLRGSGKSTYIRHLINVNSDKDFVYVPASLIPLLGDPSFGTFLQTLANHVIILEDCENAIQDRKSGSGSSAAVSLLLNMTDGLLEDDLGIKFICTFNEDVKNIDPALLRKGRLVSKYEFKALSVEKTNRLLSKLYGKIVVDDESDEALVRKTPKSDKGLTLADIYNYEEDSYENKTRSII